MASSDTISHGEHRIAVRYTNENNAGAAELIGIPFEKS
jgi:hypothetical protein